MHIRSFTNIIKDYSELCIKNKMKPLSMQIDFYNLYIKHSCIWWGVLDTTLRDKICLRLTKLTVVSSCTTTGFPPSNNKDSNDETEIFLENGIKTTIILFCVILDWTLFFLWTTNLYWCI